MRACDGGEQALAHGASKHAKHSCCHPPSSSLLACHWALDGWGGERMHRHEHPAAGLLGGLPALLDGDGGRLGVRPPPPALALARPRTTELCCGRSKVTVSIRCALYNNT